MTCSQTGRPLTALLIGFACVLSVSAEPEITPQPEAALPASSEADLALLQLFKAIADFDKESLRLALNAGADLAAGLPDIPEKSDLLDQFPDGDLFYYLRFEPGYTPLMFASSVGNEMAVRFLLMAGADPTQLSGKSRTFALWQAARHGHVGVMKLLMGITPDSEPAQFRVAVDLKLQQAVVWKNKEIVLLSPISSGKPSTPTRRGTFLITDKYKNWKSTIYDARMPYFLRLSCGDFGLHAGNLPGYPASHGCIRLPEDNARELYSMLPIGTLVEIK